MDPRRCEEVLSFLSHLKKIASKDIESQKCL